MSSPYLGEIRIFAGNFAPVGWAFCDGSFLSIAGNDALFALIGTTYGGDGQTTFALPDLRGRLPVHQTTNYTLGQAGGQESVALTTPQIPAHSHSMQCTDKGGNSRNPAGAIPARDSTTVTALYSNQAPNAAAGWPSAAAAGGGQSHGNLQPFLCLNFIIALYGIFPSPA